MKTAAAARKPRRRTPAKQEDLSARVAELALEVKGMKRLLQRTYELVQKVQEEKRPLTLADFDADDDEQRVRYEAQLLARAEVHLAEEMKRHREHGTIDEHGELIEGELPVDMREGSTCDV